jgi:hypothetical protein
LICELACRGWEHTPFNAAFLATALCAFPDEKIIFAGEDQHVGYIRATLKDQGVPAERIEWRDLQPPPRFGGFLKNLSANWSGVEAVFQLASRVGARRLIITNLTLSGIAALKARLLLKRPGFSVTLVHHGGIATLLGRRKWRPLIAWGNANLRQIVLGESIRQAVLARVPQLSDSLFAVRHPYFFPVAGTPSPLSTCPVQFAFLGHADKDKGFHYFCQLARRLHGQAEFKLIGHFPRSSAAMEAWRRTEVDPWVTGPSESTFLSNQEYRSQLADIAYAVLPYDPEDYSLIASASMIDCFAGVKPAIALLNPQFEELGEQVGDFGYLCATQDEMTEVVSEIIRNPPAERYARQCANLLRGRALFEPATLAAALRRATG